MESLTNHPYLEQLAALELQSQLGLTSAIVISVIGIFILYRVSLRTRLRRNHSDTPTRTSIAGLHQCNSASVSLEFLLVFFPLLALVLAVWQLAFMLNAQMQIGYAAYAAARSASVVTYMELEKEPEGILLNAGETDAKKWERINRAAMPGVIAISPGNHEAAALAYLSTQIDDGFEERGLPDFPPLDLGALPGQITLMTIHRETSIFEGTRLRRTAVKALYAERATDVRINGRNETGDMTSGEQQDNKFDLSSADTLEVSVEYDFWLNVPYAGRMMKLAFDGAFDFLPDRSHPTLRMAETVIVKAWPKVKAY